ncbi:MAG: MFS transporter [Chlamydiia bacterium]|nr:MFS transporter [Chlamydiia bacterium]
MTALLVAMGKLGDIYGRRRIFSLGLVIFALACLGAALSLSSFWLIIFRALQGVGFAMLIPTSQALLTHAFPEEEHGKAMGIWATLAGLGLVLGPVLGGVIVSFLPWSWIFYINVPIALISFILVKAFATESKNEEHPPHLDIKGIILFILGFGSIIFAVIQAPEWGWTSPAILSLFAIALIFLLVFYFVEKRTSFPLIEFSFFKNRCFTAGALAVFSGCFLFWVTFFLVPLYLQNYRGEPPWLSGLILLSVGIPFTVTSHFAGSASDRIDKRKLIPSGLLLVFLSMISFILLGSLISVIVICAILLIFGIGQATLWSPGTSLGISALPRSQSGVASGALTTLQETGGSVGIALAGTVFRIAEIHHYTKITDSLQLNVPPELVTKIQSLLSTPQKLSAFLSQQTPAIDHRFIDIFKASFLHGFHVSMILAAALSLTSMLAIFFLLKKKPKP